MQIEARDLTMKFNDAGRVVEVFEGLQLAVQSGESLAIIGESGVGKTTLLHLLGMLERPVGGEVWYGEECVVGDSARRRDIARFRGKNIGFVFQSHYLLPEFDAEENVAMPLIIQGERQGPARERARALLERVGLEHRITHRPGALSGGEQQRVAIARALVASPGVVLADEPTGNLDRKTAAEIQQLLLEMHHEVGTTLLIVTHSLELARSMNRVVELTGEGLQER